MQPKRQSLVQLAILLAILVLANVVASKIYTRFDLTKEKRFTLTQPTRDMLRNLDDVVYVKVYLEGEFPAGFKRLRNSTLEMLNAFKAYSDTEIQYEFINPMASPDQKEREAIAKQLMDKGLEPTRLVENQEGYSEKIIFPGALISYKGREMPVMLLQQQADKGPQETLNTSIALLEYNLANTISKLKREHRPALALIEGNGELPADAMQDMVATLSRYFLVDRFDLSSSSCIDNKKYDAIIVAKPTQKFEESQKYKIDQFVMNGGKVLWLIENMRSEMDSLKRGSFVALDYGLNLEDQLFKYGVRVNFNNLKDLQCEQIPITVGTDQYGNARQMKLFPWMYFPVITNTNNNHPLSKNLDAVLLRFAATIDTIPSKDAKIKKTILLSSSKYSKTIATPVKIDVAEVRIPPKPEEYSNGDQAVAVALEGEFPSVFKNRLAFADQQALETAPDCQKFKDLSKPTRMVVVSDGDIIRNDFDLETRKPSPLGFYKYTKSNYANRDFLLNAVEWLTDETGVIAARSKDIKLRLLDEQKVKSERLMWQLVNVALPILLIVVFGFAYNFWRNKRYGKIVSAIFAKKW